jgi:hypothetical protein
MADINLHDLSHDELTHLINEATNLRTTKFESDVKPEKPYLAETEDLVEQKKLESEMDIELATDPFRSPTA